MEQPEGVKPKRSWKRIFLVSLFGMLIYLTAESFQPPGRQPSVRICLGLIDAYQAVGSPAMKAAGVQCRYVPSCSHYAEDAISYYGSVSGVFRTIGRLLRCAPWGGRGFDPAVPAVPLDPPS